MSTDDDKPIVRRGQQWTPERKLAYRLRRLDSGQTVAWVMDLLDRPDYREQNGAWPREPRQMAERVYRWADLDKTVKHGVLCAMGGRWHMYAESRPDEGSRKYHMRRARRFYRAADEVWLPWKR